MNYNKNVGLHLKLEDSLCALLVKAQKFNVLSFQFFLTKEHSFRYPKIDPRDLKNFLKISKNLENIYIHSSYWINLCSGKYIGYQTSQRILKKEIDLAKKLNIKNIVLHPGSAGAFKSSKDDPKAKLRGIENLTRALNKLLKYEKNIRILLENTAHGNRTVGSDLYDFKIIKNKLDYPEKVKFCLDLSHAFAYGYNIEKTEEFIEILDSTMGIKNIKLIHLNDSAEKKGAKIDKHEAISKGTIDQNVLKSLIFHPKLQEIPIILEIPNLPDKDIFDSLKTVNSWF